MRFSNSKATGLGEQLPSGVVRVYMRDARGQPQFVGEDHIGHTSAGSELALRIGDAFDVSVQPTLVATRRINKRKTEYDMSYLLRNARSAPVLLTLRQDGLWRDNELLKESIKGRRTDSDSFAWDVNIPANGEATLTYHAAQRLVTCAGRSVSRRCCSRRRRDQRKRPWKWCRITRTRCR